MTFIRSSDNLVEVGHLSILSICSDVYNRAPNVREIKIMTTTMKPSPCSAPFGKQGQRSGVAMKKIFLTNGSDLTVAEKARQRDRS